MATGYLRGLLGDEEYETARGDAFNNALLMAGLQGLMASGPSLTPTSFGQIVGQAGMAGLEGYQGSMQQAEQQALQGREMAQEQEQKDRQAAFNKALQGVYTPNGQINYGALQSVITQFPDLAGSAVSAIKSGVRPVVAQKLPEIITAKPGETLYTRGPDGQLTLVASVPKEGGTVIDNQTDAYMLMRYGTKDFAALPAEAKADVLRYANAPNDTKLAELQLTAEQTAFNMPGGVQTQIPQGRSGFLQPQTPQMPQQPAPMATPTPWATGQQQPPMEQQEQGKPTYMGMSADRWSKPLGEKEVPLIQSQGISPANKEKLALEQPQQTSALEYSLDTVRQMRNSAVAIYNHPKMQAAFGFGGQSFSAIPGTAAADVKALLDTLKNQSFVAGLQSMRQASPTGGAVGNVSNAEGARFENLYQNLEQAQSPEAAQKALLALIEEMERSETRMQNAYKRTYGTVPQLTLRPYAPLQEQQAGGGQKKRPLSEIMR